ncbi:retrovirus-related Pol polyprotein from transposon 17.6 [Trichonephila clavipes]|nr:retrovirus-related Pol polyprotein from transposon 17.6 [Trichonephila clavipes]
MSTLDLKSGYFQLANSPKDIEKTAFIIRNGTFAFLRMPFGLSGVAPNFQKAFDIILKPVPGRFVMSYMNDVIITSPSFNEHIHHLNQVFMADWYLKFIPHYADICEPLYRLKKNGAKFYWSTEAQDYFNKVKRALTEAPVLELPNFQEQFNLFTDASGVGIGTVLNQNHRPIAFASRTLNKAERNYTITERECSVVIWALNKFRTYFGSLPVKNVVTDVLSKNPIGNLDGSHILCAALRALALNSREQLIREQRVLEVRNNNLIIWKKGRRVTVNIDQVRVYHPRQFDTISFDSNYETLYEGKGSSNGWSRSHPGKSRSSRRLLGDKSKSRKSNKETAGLENLRLKRKVRSNGTVERNDRKRSKICRKRSFQGSEHGDQKIPTPVVPQGIKITVPSSLAFRSHKYRRNNSPSQGPESIAGSSLQQMIRQLNPPTEESRRGARVQYDKARETRTTRSKGHSAAEGRPVRSRQTTTVRPCPYYLRSRLKEPERIPEEQSRTGINSLPQDSLRRRSLNMDALDGDPADKSE